MTPEKLMEIARLYHEHRDAIMAELDKQLHARRPQKEIAKDFGLNQSSVSNRAGRLGISYYSKQRAGKWRAGKQQINGKVVPK